MLLWEQWVDLFRMMISSYAQVCGGNFGGGVLLAAITVRALLFPLTLRIAKAAHQHQQAMKKLQPELERLRKKHKQQPEKLGAAMQALFRKHNVAPLPVAGCLGTLAQMPIFLAVYSAVRDVAGMGGRFLWIRNLAKPDLLLTCLVALATYASVAASAATQASSDSKHILLFVPVAITVLVLVQTSAGLGLYWGVSSAAGVCQTWIVQRGAKETLRP